MNVCAVCEFCVYSEVIPRTFGCVAMCSAVLFILRSRLFVYSARSGVSRVQVVLSGFNVRYGCMYFFNNNIIYLKSKMAV